VVEQDPICHKLYDLMPAADQPLYIFQYAEHMTGQQALDVRTNQWVAIPPAALLVAGIDCGTLSKLSTQKKRQRHCLETGEGQTGRTFQYLLQFIASHRQEIAMILLENVPDIASETEDLESQGMMHTPLDDLRDAFAPIGFALAFWSFFKAAEHESAQTRPRFYGIVLPASASVAPASASVATELENTTDAQHIWDLAREALRDANGSTTVEEHLVPASALHHHTWLQPALLDKGRKRRAAPKEMAKSKQRFESYDIPFPPPALHTLVGDANALARMGLPSHTELHLHCLSERQDAMLYFKMRAEKLVSEAVAAKTVVILPAERSWKFFRPVWGKFPTLCANSRVLVGDFRTEPATIRPLLPCEMFGLQAMALADIVAPGGGDPEDQLASFATDNDIIRITWNAFHCTCATAALVSGLLAAGRF